MQQDKASVDTGIAPRPDRADDPSRRWLVKYDSVQYGALQPPVPKGPRLGKAVARRLEEWELMAEEILEQKRRVVSERGLDAASSDCLQQSSATPLKAVCEVALRAVKTECTRVKSYCIDIQALCSSIATLTDKTLYRETAPLHAKVRAAVAVLTQFRSLLRSEYDLLLQLSEQAQEIRCRLRDAKSAGAESVEIRHAFARPARLLRLDGTRAQKRAEDLYEFYVKRLGELRQAYVGPALQSMDGALSKISEMGYKRWPLPAIASPPALFTHF